MSDRRRKVLFITFDQWRGDALGVLGGTPAKTPTIDQLVADSTVFRRHFTCSAPCGPSRATLLTGRYPFVHRSVRNGTPLDARFSNLALEARRAGVEPVLFGYTDTALDPRAAIPGDPRLKSYESPLEGFTLGVGMFSETDVTAWAAHLRKQGHSLPDDHIAITYGMGAQRPERSFQRKPAFYAAEDSDTAFTADRVIDYIHVNQKREWLIHASFLRPHPPLTAPAPYNEMIDSAAVPVPPRASTRAEEAAAHPFMGYWLDKVQADPNFFQPGFAVNQRSDAELRDAAAVYYGLLAECDTQLARILAALEESGQLDDTLIVLTADHGEMLGSHWMWGKGGFYDASNHIPLIIRDPERPGGGRHVTCFTESVDIAPTILGWLGAETPLDWDGRTLAPWLSWAASPCEITSFAWREAAFWEFDFREVATGAAQRALGLTPDQCVLNVWREERWKLVWFAALPPLLFDLKQDPNETVNLAERPEHAATLASLLGKLLSRRMIHAERTLTNTQLTPRGVARYQGPRE
ncbi:MAG: alkaline phosphatase family protein [Rhodobacteraceae bacterium]|nr:alkaline phosphatase family protein [Paracoccaceae bacterium]